MQYTITMINATIGRSTRLVTQQREDVIGCKRLLSGGGEMHP